MQPDNIYAERIEVTNRMNNLNRQSLDVAVEYSDIIRLKEML